MKANPASRLLRTIMPVLLLAPAVPAQSQQPPDLHWLAGCWASRRGDLVIEEQWLGPRGGVLLGVSRTARRDTVIEYEYMRIYPRAGGFVFAASPSGQTPAEFTMAAHTAGEVVFENLGHDFPQRIIYRHQPPDSLIAAIEGERAGNTRRIVFRYARAACVPAAPGPSPAGGAAALPAEVRAACDSAAARWALLPGATLVRGETTLSREEVFGDMVGDDVASTPVGNASACRVAGMHPAGIAETASPLYWPSARWPLLWRLAADGPDGSVQTYQQGRVRCQVREEWDGGDDSDSTYVPDPFYRETTLCWWHGRALVPADTAPGRT